MYVWGNDKNIESVPHAGKSAGYGQENNDSIPAQASISPWSATNGSLARIEVWTQRRLKPSQPVI